MKLSGCATKAEFNVTVFGGDCESPAVLRKIQQFIDRLPDTPVRHLIYPSVERQIPRLKCIRPFFRPQNFPFSIFFVPQFLSLEVPFPVLDFSQNLF